MHHNKEGDAPRTISSSGTRTVMTACVDRPLIAGPEVKALCVGVWPTKVRPSSFPLNLPIDDNPESAANRKQVLFFTKEGRLCDQTSTFAAGAKITPRIACLDVVARRFVRRGVRGGSARCCSHRSPDHIASRNQSDNPERTTRTQEQPGHQRRRGRRRPSVYKRGNRSVDLFGVAGPDDDNLSSDRGCDGLRLHAALLQLALPRLNWTARAPSSLE
jgi:hypothetical protein